MIIVRLLGGLGNQMFQYALGRRVAYERETPLKMDITWFQTKTSRTYQLEALKIRAEIASPDEIEKLRRTNLGGIKRRIYHVVQRRVPYYHRHEIIEKVPFFDPNIIREIPANAYLIGYWQSEKYFSSIASLIREEFQLNGSPSNGFNTWNESIRQVHSVGLHVRRGDFIDNLHFNQIHGTCTPEYYSNAVQYIRKHIPDAKIFVFSDDLAWAIDNLTVYDPVEFIELESQNRDQEELLLMSLCAHQIIANSSFSWWGAWLNNNPQKIVIAPKTWFTDPTINTGFLIPESWIMM